MACIERVLTSAHARLHLVQMGHDATITNTFTSCWRDYSVCLCIGLVLMSRNEGVWLSNGWVKT